MIRIDAMWLAADPIDMRAGAERLLARRASLRRSASAPWLPVRERPRHARQAAGARRLRRVVRGAPAHAGRFVWPSTTDATPLLSLTPAQFDALVLGLPWQLLPELSVITRA